MKFQIRRVWGRWRVWHPKLSTWSRPLSFSRALCVMNDAIHFYASTANTADERRRWAGWP